MNNSAALLEQALAQAGYAAAGLSAGAREVLIGHVEELARRHGLDRALVWTAQGRAPDGTVAGAAPEAGRPAAGAVYTCMKEGGAAAMAALIGGTANTLEYLERVHGGSLAPGEAVLKVSGEAIASAADSALSAAGDAGARFLKEKWGSEDAALCALARQGVESLLAQLPGTGGARLLDALATLPTTVPVPGAGSGAAEDLSRKAGAVIVRAAQSRGSIGEMAARGAMGLLGGKFPGMAKLLAQGHPALRAASAIAMLAQNLAIKNGIERPWQDLVQSTTKLRDAAGELEKVAAGVLRGQRLFAGWAEDDARLETCLKERMAAVDRAGAGALDAILKI